MALQLCEQPGLALGAVAGEPLAQARLRQRAWKPELMSESSEPGWSDRRARLPLSPFYTLALSGHALGMLLWDRMPARERPLFDPEAAPRAVTPRGELAGDETTPELLRSGEREKVSVLLSTRE